MPGRGRATFAAAHGLPASDLPDPLGPHTQAGPADSQGLQVGGVWERVSGRPEGSCAALQTS